ncbi:MAG: hypothetical protein A2Y62_14705 [Candidatus Fischerbacteria bacterium RBG_13_37_8]|uniref:Uncharacterized protein n=1 Tax=Candidatus Fischerbacteria bacterium RBG_13_37_8 TaxID=1817863 RepID=A0A1F5VMR1_9BACT|nr:MAG: hypothetical protein A2Y62_14705 [Candidatus Fischerbacteria bacterium RBG_13_37_8]
MFFSAYFFFLKAKISPLHLLNESKNKKALSEEEAVHLIRQNENTIRSTEKEYIAVAARKAENLGIRQSKFGGKPYFPNDDPWEYLSNDKEQYELLFQMDSREIKGEYEIIRGDVGVANYFIKRSDLKNLDF